MIVIDTHALVWALDDSDRLGAQARALIDQSETVLFSAISIWEIALLVKKSRLMLNKEIDEWMKRVFDLPGLLLAPLDPAIAIDSVRLPGEFHNDPADRIIIATARHHGVPLLTADRAILDYAKEGHVTVVDASL
jgi:PIN domain nuclease of toxin-antitoxin system